MVSLKTSWFAPAVAAALFLLAFDIRAAGMVLALLPGYLLSYFFIDARNTLRILLSLPLSMFAVLVPTWSLSILGVPMSGTVLVAWSVALSAALAALLLQRGVKFGLPGFEHEHVMLAALVIVIVFIASPLHSGQLPRTDGTAHYYKSWLIENSIDREGKIPLWDKDWYAGYPIFDFYPPLSYYLTAYLGYFVSQPLNYVYDYVLITAFLWLGIGTFLLMRQLGFNMFSGFIAGLLIVVSPRLSTNMMFSGQFPTIAVFMMVPVFMVVLHEMFKKRNISLMLLSGIILPSVLMTHHLTGYFAVIVMMLMLVAAPLRNIKNSILSTAVAVAVAAVILSVWTVPLLLHLNYSSYASARPTPATQPLLESAMAGVQQLWGLLTFTPDVSCNTYGCFESIGAMIFAIAVVGVVIGLLNMRLMDKGLSLQPRLERNKLFLVLFFFVVAALALSPNLRLTEILPLGSQLGLERFTFYIILPMALLGGLVGEMSSGLGGRKLLLCGALLSVIVTVILSNYVYLGNCRAQPFGGQACTSSGCCWNSESAALNNSFDNLYGVLRQAPDARVVTYGVFMPPFVSAIPVQTGQPMLLGWYVQGSSNYPVSGWRVEGPQGSSLFTPLVNPYYMFSIYQKTWTGWVVVNLCSEEGTRGVNKTFAVDDRYRLVWRDENGRGCMVVIGVPGVAFAESVKLTAIKNSDEDRIKDKIYETRNGYKVYMPYNTSSLPGSEYSYIITQFDYNRSNEIVNSIAYNATPLAWKRTSDSITVRDTKGWTLVKESYYPVWRAYSNGRETPIYKSDMGFMLFKSYGDVELRRSNADYYPGAVVTLVAVAFLFYVAAVRPLRKSDLTGKSMSPRDSDSDIRLLSANLNSISVSQFGMYE